MSIQLELSMEIQKKSRFILKNCAETNGASVSSENPNRIASIILI
jgi:transcription initiation factor TFIIIB Brf1 subunit/transcription initiation factor TFIIB